MSKLTAAHGPISVEYTLPSGEVVSISFEDRYDSRLQPTIDFQLKGGEIVWALMKLSPEQRILLETLNDEEQAPGGRLELFSGPVISTAYELHQRHLANYDRGFVWITYNGRKLLSKLP